MKKWIVLILLGGFLLPSICTAIDLKQSKFTQVVNNVEIISATDKTRHTAAVNDIFSMPDVLRTGPDSRAELDAVDGTITRVGANTIFSFDPLNRTIDLQQGSLLFHSPKGKGGGTIRTGSATASVIGTTIIITATPNGGFKLLDLEGQAEVRFLNGINQTLEPGQMTFILPSGQTSPILVFRLDSETKGSTLVSGFTTPLDSQSKINSEITQQLLQILNGTAADTGLIVGNNATPTTVQTVQGYYNSQQSPTPPPSGFAGDGSIVGEDHVSTLPVNYAPLDPNHLQNTSFTPPTGIDSISQGLLFLGIFTPASGFIGNNIDIDTGKVDLSSFKGAPDFDIVAKGNMKIWQSVNFDKVTPPTPSPTETSEPQLPDVVSLIAGGQMLIASGSTLEADTGTFGLVADSFGVLDTDTGLVGVGGQNTLEDVSLINNAGGVDVLSLSDFTFASGSINGGSDGSESTGGEVEIQSDGTLTLGSESTVSLAYLSRYNFTIDSGANVKLLSTGQMDILDSQIDSTTGNMEADAGGAIYINGSYLYANSEDSLGGNVTIDGAGVQIFGTYIYGYGGNVDITSAGAAVDIDSSEINAAGYILPGLLANTTPTIVGGVVNITGGGDVGIYDHSTIDAGGNVNITSGDASSGGGDLNIESSTVYAGYDSSFGGSVDLNAENGAVYISGSHLSANEAYSVGGNVTIAGDGVQIYSTTIYGAGGVDIASSGMLSVGTDPAFDVTITAGSEATLSAAGAVDMTDTGITAGDDVSITSQHGGVDIYGSDIYADYGAVSINAGGNMYLSSSGIESGYYTSTAYDVDINAGGTIDLEDTYIYATGAVNIESGNALTLGQSSSDEIVAGGLIELKSDKSDVNVDYDLYAGGDVDITSGSVVVSDYIGTVVGGNIQVESSDIEAGDSDYASTGGNVNINAINGTVDIDNSYISANGHIFPGTVADTTPSFVGGDVTISGSGTVGIYNDSTIDAAADANITSTDGGDVNVESSYVYGGDSDFGGSVTVNAEDGDVLITGSTLSASDDVTVTGGGGVTISGSTITVNNGLVNIESGGNLTVGMNPVSESLVASYDTTITAGTEATLTGAGEVDITDTGITAADDVSITSDGTASFVSPGNLSISESYTADNINISGSSITSDNGDVSIVNSGGFSVSGTTVSISDSDISFDNISISDSTITADNGGVLIEYDGQLNRSDSISFTISGSTLNANDIFISGSSITANNGDVDIWNYKNEDNTGPDSVTEDSDVYTSDISITSESTITANNGNVDIKTQNGGIDLENSTVYADDCIRLCADAGVTIYNDTITSGEGVKIHSKSDSNNSFDGNMYLTGDTITAGTDATISGDGNVAITDSTITANGGDVMVSADDGMLTINADHDFSVVTADSIDEVIYDIEASSDVSLGGDCVSIKDTAIQGGDEVDITGTDGNVKVIDADIETGNGDIDMTAYNGTLTLDSGNADYGVYIEAGGAVNLSADYDVDIYDSTIYADNGDVDITSQGTTTVTLENAAVGTIDIENTDIYAGQDSTVGGSVNINAYNGDVYLSGDDIEAYAGVVPDLVSISDGDVTIYGSGTVDVENSYVSADGTVSFTSGGMLTINADHDFSEDYYEDISAGGDVTLDGGTCAKVMDTVIYAYGGVTLTGEDGNVKVIDADIETGNGDIDMTAYNGTLTLDSGNADYGVYIEAGGAVNLSADYDVDIYDSTIYADNGDVDITSQGTTTVILENAAVGSIDIENTDIYAGQESTVGGSVNINAYNGNVYLSGDDIEAYAGVVPDLVSISDGDVTIYGSGTVDVENSYIYATGNLNIESGDTLTLGQNNSDSISKLAGPSRISINANGVVNLTSDNADVDVYDYAIYADGSDDSGNGINVSAGGNVDIEDSLDIYAEKSGVNIAAAGNVYLYDDEIYASYKSGTGGISIVSSGSTVDVDYTYLDAEGDVNIESSDTLTLEDSSEIDSYGLDGVSLDAISLTSDNADVDVYDSSLYAYSGSVNVGAADNVNIENSDIYAYDNVNITSSTGSAPAPDAFIPAPGSVDIEYSYIYAGYNISSDEVSLSTDGGSVNITAWNGDVDLYDDEINAYSGAINDGDVNIYASGSVDLEDVYRLYADDSIKIEGVNTVTVEDGSDLDAYNGNVSLTSDNADVNVYDSEIYSDYGNVNINAAGSVYVSDGNIQAGYYSDTIGDVNIHASSGTADFENTDIEASGGVYIESSGTLTLNYSKSNDDDSGYHEIYSGGGPVNLKSDYGDVDINNYDVYAEGGNLNINAGGGPALSGAVNTGGNVDIENTDFQVFGSAYLNATGNVYVNNSYFDMYEGGDVNVNAGGNIDVLYTDGSGSGSVSLTAGGYVNAYDYALNMGSFDVAAGTYADFGADQYVNIQNSTIAANGGDVNITGNSAGVDIDGTTINGSGDIDITAGGGYHVDSLSTGGHAAPAYIAPSAAGGKFVVLGNFTPETYVEPAPISAPVDNVDVVSDTSTYVQSATVDLEANIDANIQNNSRLVSDSGNMMVNSGGTEEVDSSYIEANGSVYLTAVGSVSLSDSLASSDVYSDIYADNGDVDIQSSGSTVDIENTYIYSHGSVNIEGSGTLTLGYNSGNSIAAYNGNVSLTSDNADVDVDNYDIYSDYGNVYISAAGNVNLSGDSVHSGYDSETGDVKIQSLAGTVDLEAAYIGSAGNVGILSYDTLTLGNTSGNEIYANGWVNLSSTTGNVDIDRYSIYTYGSDIDGNGVTISAAGTLTLDNYDYVEAYNGSVNLNAGGDVNIDNSDYIYTGDGDLDISAGGSISMNDNSDVEANNGSVNVSAGGTIYLYNNELYGNNADVNITALGVSSTIDIEDTYISAYGNVNIESSGTLTLGSLSAWTIDAGNAISLKSDNADVVINTDYELDADGSDINGNGITISAGGNVDIENDGDIYADYGGVKIAAVGSVYLYDDEIYAGYDDTDNGNLTIASSGSTVDVDDTYLDAEGDVNIESGDTLTLENSSEIDSYGYNGISLTSDNADVDVYDSFLYAYYGNVDIYATGNAGTIDLQSDDISAYGNVNVESDSTLTLGNSETGGDTIYAGSGIYLSSNNGDVDVYNSSIYGGFANNNDGFDGTVDGISILDGSTITADGAVNLNSYGATVSIYAPNGNINIGHTTINPGGGIGISDSTITANGSDINGNGVSIYSDGYFYIGGRSDTLFSDDIEGNNISISGSTITANNGGISIVNDAYASTADAAGFNVENTTLIYGDVNISSGSTITADNGNINISTSSLELFNASSAYSSDISLNDISIYDSTISASGGNVTVSAGGYLTTGTEIVAADKSGIAAALASPYAVSINASGDISLYGYSGANLDVTTAEAGGKFDLESDNFVDVYNSSLIADTGDLHIYGDYGNVDVEYSTIKATQGNVNIGAGFTDVNNNNSELLTLNGVTITAGEAANLTSSGGIHVDDSGITAASITLETLYGAANLDANYFGSSTLTAATGDTDIYAENGNVDVEGSTIKATLGNVNIGAGFKDASDINSETLALDGASITAGKSVTVSSSGTASLTGGSITGNNNVNVNAGSGITINGTAINADDTTYGNITLTSTAGQTTIQNGASMTAYTLTVNSPDGILIDGTGSTISGNTMNLTTSLGDVSDDTSGGHTVTVQNDDLGQFQTVNIQAHTVNLSGDNFTSSSSYNFTSFYHGYHINDGIVPGFVNFINDTLDHVAIENTGTSGLANQSNNGGIGLGGVGSGIHIN